MGNTPLGKSKSEEIGKHYVVKEKLGTGSFAVVKRGIRKSDGKEFALKIVTKKKLGSEELQLMKREAEIMNDIEHEHVVKLEEIFDTPKTLYLVLEMLQGGELFERIVEKGSYSEKEASVLLSYICKAIQYLHSINIVHRDMKPENLIYDSKADNAIIKITDFGLAKKLEHEGETMRTACGTPGFVAPEILKNKPYDHKVDMWSIGVILYIILCGFPPFYDENARRLYVKIKKGQYNFPDPYWTEISKDAKDLVTKLLCVDPKKRYSTEEVLAHPWVAKNTASNKPLGKAFKDRLGAYNARQKFRRGIQMLIAVDRLTRALLDADE